MLGVQTVKRLMEGAFRPGRNGAATHVGISAAPLKSGIFTEYDVPVAMRDGVILRVNVFRSAEPGRYPVVVAVSPFGKDDYRHFDTLSAVSGASIGEVEVSNRTAFGAPDPGLWVPQGYVVVHADARGQGKSDGKAGPFHKQDREDGYDLVEWAGIQSWSNGSVGLNSSSFYGQQSAIASLRPPHLKAIVVGGGWSDLYSRFYFSGIPESGFMRWVWERWIARAHNRKFGFVDESFLATAGAHPLRDSYWRTFDDWVEQVNVPTLVCASFSDQGLGARDVFDAFRRLASEDKWLFAHRRPNWAVYYGKEAFDLQKRFLDFYLKGQGRGLARQPRLRIEVSSSRTSCFVTSSDAWPPKGTEHTPFHLDVKTRALRAQTSPLASHAAYESAASNGLSFDVRVERPMDIIGTGKVKLWVSIDDGDDMDLFVAIRKLNRAGKEVHFYGAGGLSTDDVVSRGWLRVSHRELDQFNSRPWHPVLRHDRLLPVPTKEVIPVEIELEPTATHFDAGETLRLVVQGTRVLPDSPLFEFDDIVNRGRHRIYSGGYYDSHMLLPVRHGLGVQ